MAEFEARVLHPVGTAVERDVDGQWFLAKVVGVDEGSRTYTLRYADDGNEEDEVPHDETRVVEASEGIGPRFASARSRPPVAPPFMTLTGILAREEEERVEKEPTIIVHRCGSLDVDDHGELACVGGEGVGVQRSLLSLLTTKFCPLAAQMMHKSSMGRRRAIWLSGWAFGGLGI